MPPHASSVNVSEHRMTHKPASAALETGIYRALRQSDPDSLVRLMNPLYAALPATPAP